MLIISVPIETITPYENNPRNNQAGIEKTARSISEFGWRQPIVVDKHRVIVAGHTRLLAAKKLGLKEVPIHIADTLTEDEIVAYRIADNRVAEESSWDTPLLISEIKYLHENDFDLSSTGFNSHELDALLNEAKETKIPEIEYKSKFEIVVECEDEIDQETIYKLMTSKGYKCRILSM